MIKAGNNIAAEFRIEKAETREVPAPFNEERTATGDVVTWARSYAGFLRAFTESILVAAIPDELPGPEIVQEVYRRVEHRLVTDPGRYEFHYISVGALLTRI